MNPTEPQPISDGYYWAHTTCPDSGEPCPWETVNVCMIDGEQLVAITGEGGFYPLSDFTFGPRIEEPTTPPPA